MSFTLSAQNRRDVELDEEPFYRQLLDLMRYMKKFEYPIGLGFSEMKKELSNLKF